MGADKEEGLSEIVSPTVTIRCIFYFVHWLSPCCRIFCILLTSNLYQNLINTPTRTEIALVVVKTITSFLSMVGSSLIMICIFRQRAKRPVVKDTLHQLLLGLSASDWLLSLGIFTSPYMVPSGALQDYPWYLGNDATCTVSAFTVTWLALSAASYNGFLAMHFWRSVRNSHKKTASRRARSEKTFAGVAHLVSIGVPGFVAIFALVGQYYKPHPFLTVCYFSVKGSQTAAILGRSRLAFKWAMMIIAIFCTLSLAHNVRANLRKSRQYASSWNSNLFANTIVENTPSITPISSGGRRLSRRCSFRAQLGESEGGDREREVLYQSCWYLLAYFNTFLPSLIIWIVVQVKGKAIMAEKGDPGV